MSRIYDNWERLVEATLKRQQLREIALYCESLSSAASDSDRFDSFREDLADAEDLSSSCPKFFPLNELKKATRNFQPDNLLGEGESSSVFIGKIEDHSLWAESQLTIAVKKLRYGMFQDHQEWLAAVNNMWQLCHPNLVKLLAYCSDDVDRFLIHEFIPKGSLRHHLSTRLKQTLSWDTRIHVAIGVAKGLSFLHDRDLIHGDVKSSSILLDEDSGAKLSGFLSVKPEPVGNWTQRSGYWSPPHGYSPPSPGNSPPPPPSRTSGYRPIGYRPNGYQAPKYIPTGDLTAKCDVYSFGVVLIELLCGRCANDPKNFSGEQNLVNWAWPYLFSKRKMLKIMDTKLEGQYPRKEVSSVAAIAWKCVNPYAKLRPSMTNVLEALEKLQGPKTRI